MNLVIELMRIHFYAYLSFVFFMVSLNHTLAADEASDIATGFGSLAWGLTIVGFAYVVVRRAQVISKSYLSDDYKEVKDFIREFYRKFRQPLITLHYIVNIAATITAIVHGILLSSSELPLVIAGWVAVGSMILLSLSGILIWARFKPIWTYRESRTALRLVHRQWLFSGIFLLGFLVHLAFT